MYIYGIQDAAGLFHYVGLSTKTPNLRFNWHVWAARHPESPYHNIFHMWLANQDLSTLKVMVLQEPQNLADLKSAAHEWYAKLVSEGHPLKCKKNGLGQGADRVGTKLTPEHIAAMQEGRRNSNTQVEARGERVARRKSGAGQCPHHATAHLFDGVVS